MINTISGRALVDKTPKAARNLVANMAVDSQEFKTRHDLPLLARKVNEMNTSYIEQQLANPTSLVQQLAVGNLQ